MESLVFKAGSYYGIFSRGNKKKWLKIGRVDKKQAKKMLMSSLFVIRYIKLNMKLNTDIHTSSKKSYYRVNFTIYTPIKKVYF